MLTRQEFDRQRAVAKAIERRETGLLAIVAVALGIGQLLFLRWGDRHLERRLTTTIAGVVFLVYFALVIGLLWRYLRHRAAARPRCPSCGVAMGDASVRVAAATGRCDSCGGQVIA
jgi:MFS family permease